MAGIANKYRLYFAISAEQAKSEIDKYIKNLSRKNRKNSRAIDPKQFEINRLKTIRDNLSVKQNTIAYKKTQEAIERIQSNISFRLKKNFKSSTRLERAVRDKRFTKKNYIKTREILEVGIGNFQVLDEYTLVYVQDPTDREEMFYTPPGGGYGDIDGWWVFHEYSGAAQKDEFKSNKTRDWVFFGRKINKSRSKYAHINNRSGTKYTSWASSPETKAIAYKAKPFLVKNSNKFFEEDEEIIGNILGFIAKKQLSRAGIKTFGN